MEFVANLAVKVAVAKTIEKASDALAAAKRITDVASSIGDEIDGGVLVEVDQLRPRLLELAQTDRFKSSDKMIAETLIDLIAHEFTKRVKGGLISTEAQVKLSNLCDLVCESAEPFMADDEDDEVEEESESESEAEPEVEAEPKPEAPAP